MKILMTGFNPFGGEKVNPAYEAVKLLPEMIAGAEIMKLEVPTEFNRAGEVVAEMIERVKPDVVICIGQAGGRNAITPEKVAINLQDGRIADNAGYQPADCPVREDGPAAYFSLLPVKKITEKIRESGIPASVSYTAGTYVCNDLMYSLLYLIEHNYPKMIGGFIHVPFALGQTVDKPSGTPGMELETIARGLKCAVEAVVEEVGMA